MSQRPVRVTPKSNIVDIENLDYELINDEDVGYIDKVFMFREPGADGKMKTLIRCLVYWELRPYPAPSYELPEELYWIDHHDAEYFSEIDAERLEVEAEELRVARGGVAHDEEELSQ